MPDSPTHPLYSGVTRFLIMSETSELGGIGESVHTS